MNEIVKKNREDVLTQFMQVAGERMNYDEKLLDSHTEAIKEISGGLADCLKMVDKVKGEVVRMSNDILLIKQGQTAFPAPEVSDTYITDEQAKRIPSEIYFRVCRLLDLPFSESDFSRVDFDTKNLYVDKFISRLYGEARSAGLLGSKNQTTLKSNYTELLHFIDTWEPKCGVEELKNVCIKEAAAKQKKKRRAI